MKTIEKVVKYLDGNRNRLIHNNQQQMKYDLATSKIKSAKSIAEIKSQLKWLTNSPNSISEEILKIVK